MVDRLMARLVGIVGDAQVLTDRAALASYETDWTRRWRGRARCVVRPATTEEVARVLAACHEAMAPVVPQGGNTGLVGGGVPRDGEVVLSLTRLDALEPVDELSAQVTVGAGATLTEVRAHTRPHGLDVGVDLGSRDSATIGGMVATNAGGIHLIRHGPMRRQVIGLEAVLADGRLIRRLEGLTKDNTGYDLPGLLAGSEGTLAVITRVRLGLIPIPRARVAALLAVDGIETALGLLMRLRRLPSLQAAEIMFVDGVALVCEHTGLNLPFTQQHPAYLLVECAAEQDPTEQLAAAVTGDAMDAAVATDRESRARLWAYRERHAEAINAAGVPHKLDVTLPLGALAAFERQVRSCVRDARPDARTVLYGHIGDGNLHVNVLGPPPDDEAVTDAVLRLVAAHHGSISAEHGIGVAKTRWLHLTRSAADRAAMAAIKHALDPHNLLNPGVLLPHHE